MGYSMTELCAKWDKHNRWFITFTSTFGFPYQPTRTRWNNWVTGKISHLLPTQRVSRFCKSCFQLLGFKHMKQILVGGFNPSENYEFVNWDDYSQLNGKTTMNPNHQPEDNMSIFPRMASIINDPHPFLSRKKGSPDRNLTHRLLAGEDGLFALARRAQEVLKKVLQQTPGERKHGFPWSKPSCSKTRHLPWHNYWLVVWTPLKNISQLRWLFPIYGKKCSKPPTSI